MGGPFYRVLSVKIEAAKQCLEISCIEQMRLQTGYILQKKGATSISL